MINSQFNQFNLLLQKVRVLDPVKGIEQIADVLLLEGSIKQIQLNISVNDCPQTVRVFDARNLVLAPGLVDLYSNSGEPGYEYRENLLTLARAANSGGFTRLNILPNTVPPINNQEILSSLQQKSLELKSNNLQSFPDSKFWGAMELD